MIAAGTSGAIAGIWLNDGSANNLIFGYQINTALQLRGAVFSNFAGSFAADVFTAVLNMPIGPLAWLRIQETASHRTYFISSDGVNFIQVAQEANTAHFTTAKYGFAVENRTAAGDISMTVYSLTETNP